MMPQRLFVAIIALSVMITNPVAADFNCTVCKGVSTAFAPLLGHCPDSLIDVISTPVCMAMRGDKHCSDKDSCFDLCRGIARTFVPRYQEAIAHGMSSGQVCEMLKYCRGKPPAVPVPTQPMQRSNLSDLSGEKDWPAWNNSSDVGFFLQLTDMHLDRQYKEGMSSDCHLPLCCRQQAGAVSITNRSDPKYAGYWGQPLAPCDIPYHLSEALHEWLATWDSKPNFFVNTGDDPAHDVWAQTMALNMQSAADVTRHHRIAFNDVPGFPSIGNHDWYPIDVAFGNDRDSYAYNASATAWRHWLPNDAIKTLLKHGYFAARAAPGIRVVSLNSETLIADSPFSADLAMGTWPDPNAQMAWLNDTLSQAEERNETVVLMCHHPVDDWVPAVKDRLSDVISSHRPGLIGIILHGHVHQNEFNRYPMAGTYFAPTFIGGSLTTTGIGPNGGQGVGGCGASGNPGFNLYRYRKRPAPGEPWLIDVEYWWANITEANEGGARTPPVWRKQYSAREAYGMKDMSWDSWHAMESRQGSNATLRDIISRIWMKGY